MSWSITRTGKPEEIAEQVAQAIRNSVDYEPQTAARRRTGELTASATKKIILAAASDDVRSINDSGSIAVESYGHINDDGSISSNRLSVTILSAVRELHPVRQKAPEKAPEEKTANGPDAATHEELNAVLEGAEKERGVSGIFGTALAGAGTPEDDQPQTEQSPLADDARGTLPPAAFTE